jgi:hypothetical protein
MRATESPPRPHWYQLVYTSLLSVCILILMSGHTFVRENVQKIMTMVALPAILLTNYFIHHIMAEEPFHLLFYFILFLLSIAGILYSCGMSFMSFPWPIS